MFEALSKYLSIVLDYSIVLEYSNGVRFDELTNLFEDKGIDCYIDDTFKLLHRCVVQQQDPKDAHIQGAMRSLIQSMMATNTLHATPNILLSRSKIFPNAAYLPPRRVSLPRDSMRELLSLTAMLPSLPRQVLRYSIQLPR